MIKNKTALILSTLLLIICMHLFFPFPDYELLHARSTFMSFPITTNEGYNLLGIFGSILFIVALILLVKGLEKYRFRITFIVCVAYAFSPLLLIAVYQETAADGIEAIWYDGDGTCEFQQAENDGLLNAECIVVLKNRSNEPVTFQLEFIEEYYSEDKTRMVSLMNENGPYTITIEANHRKTIQFKERIDVLDIPNHIGGGTSNYIHFKLMDGETERVL
ncbi:hypothetical protein [Bacillus sp. AK031]